MGGEECMYIYNSPPFYPSEPPLRQAVGWNDEGFLFILLWGEAGKADMLFLIPNAHIEQMGWGGAGGINNRKKIVSICNWTFAICFFSFRKYRVLAETNGFINFTWKACLKKSNKIKQSPKWFTGVLAEATACKLKTMQKGLSWVSCAYLWNRIHKFSNKPCKSYRLVFSPHLMHVALRHTCLSFL